MIHRNQKSKLCLCEACFIEAIGKLCHSQGTQHRKSTKKQDVAGSLLFSVIVHRPCIYALSIFPLAFFDFSLRKFFSMSSSPLSWLSRPQRIKRNSRLFYAFSRSFPSQNPIAHNSPILVIFLGRMRESFLGRFGVTYGGTFPELLPDRRKFYGVPHVFLTGVAGESQSSCRGRETLWIRCSLKK